MSQYIAAVDQGTTSTRFMIFNRVGQVIATARKEHRQIFPKPGWVEHDACEIWQNTREVIIEGLTQAGLKPAELAGVGITNQRETTVIWDKASGQPLTPAVVWQDTRTAPMIASLSRQGGQDRFREKTGLPLATYFSGPKIAWLLQNTPGLAEKARDGQALFGTMDTWLLWNLTGGTYGGLHITDVSNASRTMLMDLESLAWDGEILEIFGIPEVMLPKIVSSSQVYAECREPLEGVPVSGDLGDQQAALFGQTCFSPGEAKNTYGTGCFMLMNSGESPVPSRNGLLTTLGYRIGDAKPVYSLEGSVAITGALVQWLRDNLKIIEKSADVETLARTVEDSGGIYFVPAFSGLFAPYWRADARGAIVGLTRYINRGHLARAVLEATAYQTREILDAMQNDSGVTLTALKVDGGMVNDELLMQFQADILGVPVIRPKVTETTALGAAYVAGLAVGYWKSLEELRQNWGIDHTWQAKMPVDRRDRLYQGWKKAVTRTFDWIEDTDIEEDNA